MPYIRDEDRVVLNEEIDALVTKLSVFSADQLAGALNYTITKTIQDTLKKKGERVSYNVHNSIIGMLESCKLEWYRKRVAPYEDEKILENGDVK